MYYQYFNGPDPAQRCPECDQDWTTPGGVTAYLSIGGKEVEFPTSLDDEGILIDTEDEAINNGYHAGTYCGGCQELLIHCGGIEEWSQE